jgi:hypothetical protein
MTPRDKEGLLKSAAKVFEAQHAAAAVLAMHNKTCPHCRSRVWSFFTRCKIGIELEYRDSLSRLDANLHVEYLAKFILESVQPAAPIAAPKVTTEWLEKLYKLRDDRTE